MEELPSPNEFFGRPETTTLEIDSVEPFSPTGSPAVSSPEAGSPMLRPVADAAKQLGVSRSTLFRLIESGDLDTVKVASRRLVPVEALRRYVESSQETRRPKPA